MWVLCVGRKDGGKKRKREGRVNGVFDPSPSIPFHIPSYKLCGRIFLVACWLPLDRGTEVEAALMVLTISILRLKIQSVVIHCCRAVNIEPPSWRFQIQ